MTEGWWWGGICQEAQPSDEEKAAQGKKMTVGGQQKGAAWLLDAYRLCSEFRRSSVGPVFPINLSRPWQPPTAAS